MQVGIAACLLRGLPFLMQGDTHGLEYRTLFKRIIKRLILRPILRRSCGALGVGILSMQYWEAMGIPRANVLHLPYPSHLDYYIQMGAEWRAKRDQIRREMGLSDSRLVAIYVGRLVPEKGVGTLLEGICHLLPTERPHLLVVGDGPERAELEGLSVENRLPVTFLGFRENHEIPPLLAAADFFVLPSHREPWGIVVSEAMAAGLPVVLSDRVGAAYDLAIDGENGFLVHEHSAKGWSKALQRCHLNRSLLPDMGRRSIDAVRTWTCDYSVRCLHSALALLPTRSQSPS